MTEPTAPASPAAAVIKGGPAEPVAPAAAPEIVEVELHGAKVKVDKATADAIAAMREAHETEMSVLREQAAAAGRPAPAAKPAVAADDPLVNIETELFADPKGALTRLGQHIRASVKAELTQEYQIAENRKVFWQEFYKDNKDLADEGLIVNAVFNRDFNTLMAMKGADAMKHLSSKAKVELLRLKGEKAPVVGGKVVAEGGNTPGNLLKSRQSKLQDAPKGQPMSLSEAIRARKEARKGTQRAVA